MDDLAFQYLDLAINQDQRKILDPSPIDFSVGTLLREASNGAAGKKFAARKISILGEQVGACCIANDPKRLRLMQQQLNLASSIESIKSTKRDATAAKLDDPTSTQAKKKQRLEIKSREMPVWRTLSDSDAMLTAARAAQFHSPQIKELYNYIEKEKLAKPRGGFKGRREVFVFVENYIRSQESGVVTSYPSAGACVGGTSAGGNEANDDREEDLEGEDDGSDDDETLV